MGLYLGHYLVLRRLGIATEFKVGHCFVEADTHEVATEHTRATARNDYSHENDWQVHSANVKEIAREELWNLMKVIGGHPIGLYLGSYLVLRRLGTAIEFRMGNCFVRAETHEVAVAHTHFTARNDYSHENDWQVHSANVKEIAREELWNLMKKARTKEEIETSILEAKYRQK